MINRLKACLNGNRARSAHPAVPITPAELARAALDAVSAGAEAIHIHPRDADGNESLHPDDIAAAVVAVRAAGVPVGVSTGLWITDGDVGRRLASVAAWPERARPDFASVNIGEPGFAELAEVLLAAGIGVEAGVWSPADARALAGIDTSAWTRILVEIIDTPADAAIEAADAILKELGEVPGPRLLHGDHESCWPLVAYAGRLGLATRIGLEDTTVGPDGSPVADNAELVRHALAVWASHPTSTAN